MPKEVLYGIIGLLLGVGITVFVASNAVNNNDMNMMNMMGMKTQQSMMGKQNTGMMGMNSSMDDMMKSVEGKSGDEFDKNFISAMTIHHQGAIEMAKEAKANATHMELKKMADDIISAQTSEIEQMRMWQKDWKY